ncbi:anti-sigma factor [soil metagenome]
MNDEPREEQASLYVLGLLEPEEARQFEARLAEDEELRRHVDALTATAARLAHTAAPRALPSEVEGRVLAEVRGAKEPVAASASRVVWLPWAIAAALALACVITFANRQEVANQLAAARSEINQSQTRLAQTESQLTTVAAEKERAEKQVVELRQREADARVQMATLAAARDEAANRLASLEAGDALAKMQVATLGSKLRDAPDATAAVVWDQERQRGVLNTMKVPPNAADRDYQLWIVDPRYKQPVDAGVFSVEKPGSTRYAFTPKSPITAATAFAISLERKGGVPKAEGPIVLIGTL